MKKLSDFRKESLDLKNKNYTGGLVFGSGCEVVDENTWTTVGDGQDETVTYYDDNGNETGWEIRDPW